MSQPEDLVKLGHCIQAVLSESGKNRSEWCSILKCSKGAISQWISGLTSPRPAKVALLILKAREFGVNEALVTRLEEFALRKEQPGTTVGDYSFAAQLRDFQSQIGRLPLHSRQRILDNALLLCKREEHRARGLAGHAAAMALPHVNQTERGQLLKRVREFLAHPEIQNKSLFHLATRAGGTFQDAVTALLVVALAECAGPEPSWSVLLNGGGADGSVFAFADPVAITEADVVRSCELLRTRYGNLRFIPSGRHTPARRLWYDRGMLIPDRVSKVA
jgi:hypothetical protein